MNKPKRPVVVIDFTDELARQMTSERVSAIINEFIKTDACVASDVAAALLGVHINEFRSRHSKKLPIVELGSGKKGNRYRMGDIIAYRDKHTSAPKSGR